MNIVNTKPHDGRAVWAAHFARGGGLDLPRRSRIAALRLAWYSDPTTLVTDRRAMKLDPRDGGVNTARGANDAARSGWLRKLSTGVFMLDRPGSDGEELGWINSGTTDPSKGGRPRDLRLEMELLTELGVEVELQTRTRGDRLTAAMPESSDNPHQLLCWAVAVVEQMQAARALELPAHRRGDAGRMVRFWPRRAETIEEAARLTLEAPARLPLDHAAVTARIGAYADDIPQLVEQVGQGTVDAAIILIGSLNRSLPVFPARGGDEQGRPPIPQLSTGDGRP